MILTQSLISAFPCFPVFAFSLFFLPFLFSPSFLFLIFRYPYWSWDAANVPWQWPERGNRGAFKPLFSSSLPANITLTMKNTQTHTHTQSTHPHATRVHVCVCTHTHTHPEQSSWKLLPSGRCPGDCRISGTSQNRWLRPSDCCWTYLCRKVSFAVRRLGTVTLGKLDCLWRPRGLFCTLQLVWQARPPPESATGMGNTPQSGRQATLPRYSITHLCFAHKTYSNDHILAGHFPVPCVLMRKL